MPYFPLASGLLTGKYRRGEPAPEGTRLAGREIDDERLARVERMTRFAEERGHTILELAISSLASTPGMGSVIAGATKARAGRARTRRPAAGSSARTSSARWPLSDHWSGQASA